MVDDLVAIEIKLSVKFNTSKKRKLDSEVLMNILDCNYMIHADEAVMSVC